METERLRLTPYSPAHLVALIESAEAFRQSFGLAAAEGLRAYYLSGDVSPDWLARLRSSLSPDPWHHGFAIVHRAEQLVIGSIGFKGPPDADGTVEIAYGVVPGYQGRGYATEATTAGVAFGFDSGEVRRIRAHTLPTSRASIRVLEKCLFTFVGVVDDPDDGLVHRWERTR
jgi:RimJ/RimL family protein N-acetyltransferase